MRIRFHAVRSPVFGMLTLVLLLLAGTPNVAIAEEDWTLGREEAGITVQTRPVAGSGIQEFRGMGMVDAPAREIMKLLRDSRRLKVWFPNTPESELLEREGDVSYQYTVMSTPWPISDRDNILRSVREIDDATGRVTIRLEAAPDFRPEHPDRVRVQQARGGWILEPRGKDRTHVTFQMHLDPGGGIPDWMINARILATPFEAITNMRAQVAR